MEYLIFPLIAAIVAQVLKIFNKNNHEKFNWRSMLAYSGMPSSHSAMVISLSTIVILKDGFFSPVFAISFILAIIVIRDAVGIRRYIEQHGKTLNILVKDLKDDDVLDKRYPHLLEHVGHTPAQALAGALIGLVISLIGFYLL